MNEYRIESDAVIAAPVDRVWPLVTQPGWWVADEGSLSGGAVRAGDYQVVTSSEHGDFPVLVEKVEPTTYVAQRWVSAFPEKELRDGNHTLVEVTVTPEGDRTRVHLVETGIEELDTSAENRRNVLTDHLAGWPHCLTSLKTRAEAPAA